MPFGLETKGPLTPRYKPIVDRIAESTAQNTRQLVDHARRGRLVFG